jgi:hypothetical protein
MLSSHSPDGREPVDGVIDLNDVPAGYRDMNDRKSLEVMVRP